MTNNLSVTLDLQQGLTVGELQTFIEAATMLGAAPDTTVELLELENHEVGIVGLKVIAGNHVPIVSATKPSSHVMVSRATASDLLNALAVIEEQDGDARMVLASIRDLRAAVEDVLVTQ